MNFLGSLGEKRHLWTSYQDIVTWVNPIKLWHKSQIRQIYHRPEPDFNKRKERKKDLKVQRYRVLHFHHAGVWARSSAAAHVDRSVLGLWTLDCLCSLQDGEESDRWNISAAGPHAQRRRDVRVEAVRLGGVPPKVSHHNPQVNV